jgi:hypothetical protein
MSKTLTLSFALALGFCGVSFAGHGDCATCGIASPQGTVASPQGYETSCDTCAPAKKHHFKFTMPACLKPKPKTYTYEWVLKKKKVHGHAAAASCDTCGTTVAPSAQYGSPQGTYAAPQATYSAPQAYGASQSVSYLPTSETKPAPTGDSVPAAPAAPAPAAPAPPAPTGTQSSLLFLNPTGN